MPIARACSRWLRYLIGLLYRQSERYRHLVISHQTHLRDVDAEHKAIFHAARERNVVAAHVAMATHIYLTFEAIRTDAEYGMKPFLHSLRRKISGRQCIQETIPSAV